MSQVYITSYSHPALLPKSGFWRLVSNFKHLYHPPHFSLPPMNCVYTALDCLNQTFFKVHVSLHAKSTGISFNHSQQNPSTQEATERTHIILHPLFLVRGSCIILHYLPGFVTTLNTLQPLCKTGQSLQPPTLFFVTHPSTPWWAHSPKLWVSEGWWYLMLIGGGGEQVVLILCVNLRSR